VPSKIACTYTFIKMKHAEVLVYRVFCISFKTEHRWVTTDCSFMSDNTDIKQIGEHRKEQIITQ